MKKVRTLGILLVAVLLTMGMAVASENSKQMKYIDKKEYKKQINELINKVRDIRDKVKNGGLSSERAKKKILLLINNSKYSQIKLMKEIVESNRKRELEHEGPKRLPQNVYNRIWESSIVPFSSTTYYYYGVDNMTAYKGGWGVGYNIANTYLSDHYERIAARAEIIGSYYVDGYMYKYFYAPKSGNAIISILFDWSGGSLYPADCSINFVLWEYVSKTGWIKIASEKDVVSLSGYTPTQGPINDTGSVSSRLVAGNYYCLQLQIHTKGDAIGEHAVSSGDFGFVAWPHPSNVHWQYARVIYQ